MKAGARGFHKFHFTSFLLLRMHLYDGRHHKAPCRLSSHLKRLTLDGLEMLFYATLCSYRWFDIFLPQFLEQLCENN